MDSEVLKRVKQALALVENNNMGIDSAARSVVADQLVDVGADAASQGRKVVAALQA